MPLVEYTVLLYHPPSESAEGTCSAMPISGLAITLSAEPAARQAAVDALRNHPAITLGEFDSYRLPIVVETATSDDDREVWRWLQELHGVLVVDVACVHFTDEPNADSGSRISQEGSRR